MKLSAVDKNLEVKPPQEAVVSSQQERVVDAKTELSTSVEKTLESVAAGKNVVDIVNVGCLGRFARLFCFLTVKNAVNSTDLSGSVVEVIGAAVEATVKDLDLSGSVLNNVVAALQSHVPLVENVCDLSGVSVDLSGSVLQNVVTAVEPQKVGVASVVEKVSAVHEEAVHFVNKMISSSQKKK